MQVPHFTKYGVIFDEEDSSAEDEEEKNAEFREENQETAENSSHFPIKTPFFEEDLRKSAGFEEKKTSKKSLKWVIKEEEDEASEESSQKSEQFLEKQPDFREKTLENQEKPEEFVERVAENLENAAEDRENGDEFDKYSEIIEEFLQEGCLREEGLEIFEIPATNLKKPEELQQIIELEQRIFKEFKEKPAKAEPVSRKPRNLRDFPAISQKFSQKSRNFYQNLSFRTSWCVDGFVSPAGNKNGYFSINIEKIVTESEFFAEEEIKNERNYENYLRNVKDIIKKYEVLFEKIEENRDIVREKQGFMMILARFLRDYCGFIESSRRKNAVFKEFMQKDMAFIGLLDLLFGEPCLQIVKITRNLRKNEVSKDNLLEFIEKTQRKANLCNFQAFRLSLLRKWLEITGYKVRFLEFLLLISQ